MYSFSQLVDTSTKGSLLAISGGNFGPPGDPLTVIIRDNDKNERRQDCKEQKTHTAAQVNIPPMFGGHTIRFALEVGGQKSREPTYSAMNFTYAMPVVETFYSEDAATICAQRDRESCNGFPTEGGVRIMINGTNFGLASVQRETNADLFRGLVQRESDERPARADPVQPASRLRRQPPAPGARGECAGVQLQWACLTNPACVLWRARNNV